MTNRIIEISETGAYIHASNNLLIIKIDDAITSMPFEEVGALVIANPAASISQIAIVSIIQHGGIVVVCGKNWTPEGLFLPVAENTYAARNYEIQVNATLPEKKRIWRDIVKQKIKFQADLLKTIRGDDAGLNLLAQKVQSGDPENVEAQASQKYWHRIFGDEDFRRRKEANDQNRFLNYGYMVLRACTARAICAAGLHPSFGIHHHNQYNPFRLADDLMEPFRPLVDKKVAEITRTCAVDAEMTKDIKSTILEILTDAIFLEGENTTIFNALFRCAVSILHVFEKKIDRIILPEKLFVE